LDDGVARYLYWPTALSEHQEIFCLPAGRSRLASNVVETAREPTIAQEQVRRSVPGAQPTPIVFVVDDDVSAHNHWNR
jgi:hypothetical protein